MRKELLIGCGSRRVKEFRLPTYIEIPLLLEGEETPSPRQGLEFENLVTLDINPEHRPGLVCDLSIMHNVFVDHSDTKANAFIVDMCWDPPGRSSFINESNGSIDSNTFDEIHAYEVLEHIGRQGDAKTFFDQFTEFYRILKPGGLLFATCPSWSSMWAWGDPSHTRIINAGTLSFLSQAEYANQVGRTPMSDFRYLYTADFQSVYVHDDGETFLFVLKAIKESTNAKA